MEEYAKQEDEIMLNVDDYIMINISEIKKKRDEIYNVPNSKWEDIQRDIDVINNNALPLTLRTYLLNHLPYCVIKWIQDKNKDNDKYTPIKSIKSKYSTINITGSNKPKHLTDEEFRNGERGIIHMPYIMKEHTEESLKDYNEFMKKYHKQHALCPKYGSTKHSITLFGYPVYSDRRKKYKDLNRCVKSF